MIRRSALMTSVHGLRSQRCGCPQERSSYANRAARRHRIREQRRNTSKRCLHVLRGCDEAVMFHSLITADSPRVIPSL